MKIVIVGICMLVIGITLPVMGTADSMIVGESDPDFLLLNQGNITYDYITRDRIIEIAEGFLNHEWYPTEENIFHGTYAGMKVDTPDRDTYTDWPEDYGWKANQPAHGLPYQWGGFSSIDGYNLSTPRDFDEQYTGTGAYEGTVHFAGDIYTDKNYVCSRSCGLDCSGFVSRCWNSPVKQGTYTLPSISSPIRYDELQRGDVLDIPYYHVILFKEFVNEEKTMIRTIECGGPAPNVNEHVYRVITVGNDGFTVTLDYYGLTQKFGLYRYEYIDNAPETPSIDGPASGNAGTEYNYTFVATDPEGDMVSYCIDWGDDSEMQWLGPSPSGETFTVSHVWKSKGTYCLRVKAKDSHDTESGWASLEIDMPKTHRLPWYCFLGSAILEHYPYLREFFQSLVQQLIS
jgi:hypothetical protein